MYWGVDYMNRHRAQTMTAKSATPSTSAAITIILLRISPAASGLTGDRFHSGCADFTDADTCADGGDGSAYAGAESQ